MGAIGAHVPRSIRTAVPPARLDDDVVLRIDVDATRAIAALIRARAQAAKLEIAWRMAVSSQARDERRAAARARRAEQHADRIANGTQRGARVERVRTPGRIAALERYFGRG